MARKKKGTKGVNVSEKLRNVRTLMETGRIKEAIAYLYAIYAMIAGQKFGVKKENSQTLRDYAIIMVKQFKQNPSNIYPFIRQVEESVYSGEYVDQQNFQNAIEAFSKLFFELTGSNLPKF